MVSPLKLTQTQWDNIGAKYAAGVPVLQLQRDIEAELGIKISRAAIDKRFKNGEIAKLKPLIQKTALVEAEINLLSERHKHIVRTQAESMALILSNMTAAANAASNTARRMAEIAEDQITKIDPNAIMDSGEHLQAIAALTELANKASVIPQNTINNARLDREQLNVIEAPQPRKINITVRDASR